MGSEHGRPRAVTSGVRVAWDTGSADLRPRATASLRPVCAAAEDGFYIFKWLE